LAAADCRGRSRGINGFRESSGSTRKKAAQALLRQRTAEMATGGPMADEEAVTLADLRAAIVADYEANGRKSLARMKQAWAHVEEYFGKHRRAVDITPDRVKAYIAARKKDDVANSTINKELAALRRAFNLMKDAGRLSRGPSIKALATRNTRTDFLSMADVDAICAALDDEDVVPVVRFAALTGWRKAECLGLQWRNVDLDSGTIRLDVGSTKNDEGRTFPVDALPPLLRLLRQQRARTDAVEREDVRIVPHVFHRNGDRIKSIRWAWHRATQAAGLPGAWFHDLRRTAVRNLERAGVSRSVATKLTGHKTEAIYRRYAIADEEALREGVEKLAKLHGGPQEPRKVIPLEGAANE
jgi:integrase